MTRKNPHAVALGSKGGKIGGLASTPAKRRAARENGKKGGRPKKSLHWPFRSGPEPSRIVG